MIHEEKKVAKIVEELTLYFFALGADEIRSGIACKKGEAVITFEANYRQEERHKLRSLEKYLKEKKNDGMEDIYWELAGSGDPGESSQLLLIGMMLDGAEIRIEEDSVYLTLYKKLLET